MKILKYSIIAKHKRDVKIIFSLVKNIKEIKRQYFLKAHPHFVVAQISEKLNKQHCKILTFEYTNMSQYNYPKINDIKHRENYIFFHNKLGVIDRCPQPILPRRFDH